jgi:predicted Zn-ribbon and HTH transcriptional regulator
MYREKIFSQLDEMNDSGKSIKQIIELMDDNDEKTIRCYNEVKSSLAQINYALYLLRNS